MYQLSYEGKDITREYKAEQAYADYGMIPVVTGADTVFATDLVRQRWLDNYFYGQVFSCNTKKQPTD